MDVRANDAGDLVVTKGDQYDVREKSNGGEVRVVGGRRFWSLGDEGRDAVRPALRARR